MYTEANFVHSLHCPRFLLRFVKKRASRKSLRIHKVWAITLIRIKIEEK